jgi:sarcosine oxidase subunit gamma
VAEELSVERRQGVSLATIMMRRGACARELGQAMGISLIEEGGVSRAGRTILVGTGPGTWLAVSDAAEGGLDLALRSRLDGLASISDQSSGYVLFRLSGPHARKLLQRGAPIDLDPRVFGPGSAATTVIAHIGVIIWQADEAGRVFDVAVFRSFADSFADWLQSVTVAASS